MSAPYSFQIDWKHLAALALLASRDNTRYILNSVLVEACPTGAPWAILVATDGRRAGVYRSSLQEPLPAGTRLMIPLSLIAASKPGPKASPQVIVAVDEHRRITIGGLASGSRRITERGIDGNFPQWRQIMPTSACVPFSSASIQLARAADFVEIAKALGSKNGTGAMLRSHFAEGSTHPVHSVIILEHPDFIGVLMPVRTDADRPVPKWAMPVTVSVEQPAAQAPAPVPTPAAQPAGA